MMQHNSETAFAIGEMLDRCPVQIGDFVRSRPGMQVTFGPMCVVGRWIEIDPLQVMLHLGCSGCGHSITVDAASVDFVGRDQSAEGV